MAYSSRIGVRSLKVQLKYQISGAMAVQLNTHSKGPVFSPLLGRITKSQTQT